MPKEAQKKSADAKKAAAPKDAVPKSKTRSLRSTLKAILILVFVAATVIGYLRARDHVTKTVTFRTEPPKVVLVEQPTWMSDTRARRIRAVAAPEVAYSAFDHQLLVNITSLLRNHPDTAPWIKEIKSVRRVYNQ